jgi:hypothetical protein
MSLYLGDTPIAGLSEKTKYNAHHLLDFKWTDCIMNDVSWLRADTFSWQSGSVYVSAYNHLVSDLSGTTAETETIGSYTVTFYRADDGHKICLADQETTVANIYSETGIAWYYILDTNNTRFKLPRTKFGFEGTRTNVGDLVEAGLPNITGSVASGRFGVYNGRYYSGAFTVNPQDGYGAASNTGETYAMRVNFDASISSSIYGNSSTVQPPATQMYLYFYVGDYSQTAIEQTAGLNGELFNGKADVDLSNAVPTISFATAMNTVGIRTVVETYQNGTSWYRVYSDGWCEQGDSAYVASSRTIYLLKEFASINYNVSAMCGSGGSYTGVITQTTTSFSLSVISTNSWNWMACGYIS